MTGINESHHKLKQVKLQTLQSNASVHFWQNIPVLKMGVATECKFVAKVKIKIRPSPPSHTRAHHNKRIVKLETK